MRVLVTGAAGFIGNNLCRRLADDGHDIFGLDDLSGGDFCNILDFKLNFYEFDITRKMHFYVDHVVHLADHKGDDKIRSINVAYNGTKNVLDNAYNTRGTKVTTVLYDVPNINDTVKLGLFKAYRIQNKIDCKIVRCHDVYGPGMPSSKLTDIITKAIKGQDIEFEDCHVFMSSLDNVIDSIIESMGSENHFNINSETEIYEEETIYNYVKEVIKGNKIPNVLLTRTIEYIISRL